MSTDASARPGEEHDLVITVETGVSDETAAEYWQLYRKTFGELETKAAARQVLHEHEFLEEMRDPRVEKYVAWDGDRIIGISTLTRDLETVPWISAAYFAHHFPEQTARGAVFYLGLTLVHGDYRQGRIFEAMIAKMTRVVADARGLCAWDICAWNDAWGFGTVIEQMLLRNADVSVKPIDRQTYYAVSFAEPVVGM
ncbi:hypothetical protein [Nocardioides pacificus]